MFGKLRNKLKNWLGSEESKKEKTEKQEAKPELGKTPKEKPEDIETKPEGNEIKTEAKEQTEKAEAMTEQVQKGPETKEAIIEEDTKTLELEQVKKGFFSKLSARIRTPTVTQESFQTIFEELELILFENNVAMEVVDTIKDKLGASIIGTDVKRGDLESKVLESLKAAIQDVLIDPPDLLEKLKSHEGQYTIVFFGINGSGKTTSIAKLASYLKSNGISSVLAAADTFRAASIEQLEKHASRLGIPVIKQAYDSDPTAVAFDAKQYAKKHGIKAVLIDTAGRMYTKENLIKQMEKLIRVIKPELKIFVGESITGNDATQQAKTFHEALDIDGIILSKADIDEKAGTILSVSSVTNRPIYFLGTGQEYKDLQPFNKALVMKNLGLE